MSNAKTKATDETPTFNRKAVRLWMHVEVDDFRDDMTNEVDMTKLAEAAAAHFEVNDIGGPLDDETHWIWDLAAELA